MEKGNGERKDRTIKDRSKNCGKVKQEKMWRREGKWNRGKEEEEMRKGVTSQKQPGVQGKETELECKSKMGYGRKYILQQQWNKNNQ